MRDDEQSHAPLGTPYECATAVLKSTEVLPAVVAIDLDAIFARRPGVASSPDARAVGGVDATSSCGVLHSEVSQIVAALETKGVIVAPVGIDADPTRVVGALKALGLTKAAAAAVVLPQGTADAEAGGPPLTPDYAALLRELRQRTGHAGSATVGVGAGAGGGRGLSRCGCAAACATRAGGGLTRVVLEQVLGNFASASLDDRGF
ncbi:hypothetical protein FOA52_012559 [Chlamydomonas sp. UWO 241]|nr:hypothetical protein FOA52_012559 [Chlamydomonas sp. UWO 241]